MEQKKRHFIQYEKSPLFKIPENSISLNEMFNAITILRNSYHRSEMFIGSMSPNNNIKTTFPFT